MSVYWKDVNRGQNLVLSEQEGQEEIIGGYRDTKRGIDAYAQTFGYDPDRSRKGFATIEDAKARLDHLAAQGESDHAFGWTHLRTAGQGPETRGENVA